MSCGPAYIFVRAPGTLQPALPVDIDGPPPNLQSFGLAEIAEAGHLTVRLYALNGSVLF